ncbi:iron ABC transporter permease [Microbacterium kribbense]|uniref:Iron ABC transporter permease n=1 Tax=Microbacterium kribbense TaxID=433645 RepID=A0ABP7GTE9_9MICO
MTHSMISPGVAGQMMRRFLGLPALLAVLAAFYLLPIVMVAIGAFRTSAPGTPGEWSADGFLSAFSDPHTYEYFGNSALLAILVGFFTTLIAVTLCWIVTRTTAALKRIVTPLMILVLATPPLFFALSWDLMGTPNLGILNTSMHAIGLPGNIIQVGGLGGTVFVLTLKLVSLSYLMMIGRFMAMDRRLEEASLISGAGKFRTFIRVNVPVMAPSVIGAAIISIVIGLVSFDVPLIIGVKSGFRVFSTQIYAFINDDTPPSYAGASSLALVLVVIVLLLVVVKWMLLDRRQFTTIAGKGAKPEPWDIGRGTWICNLLIAVYMLLALILPALQLILGSLQPIFGAGSGLSLENYSTILSDPTTISTIMNTLLVAGLGGVITVVVALVIGLVARGVGRALRRVMELSTWLPWAAHGVVLGLGLVWAFLTLPMLTPLFGTVWIVLIGLVVASTPLASRTTDGALSAVSAELTEAAQVAGAGPVRAAVGIVGRLVVPSLLAAFVISAINIAGNLDVPILLSSPTNQVVSVAVFQLYTLGSTAEAAALFCLVLLFAAVIAIAGYAIAWWVSRGVAQRSGDESPADLSDGVFPPPAEVSLTTSNMFVKGQ